MLLSFGKLVVGAGERAYANSAVFWGGAVVFWLVPEGEFKDDG
jgi:hypothetical protein